MKDDVKKNTLNKDQFIKRRLESRPVLTRKQKIFTTATFFCGVALIILGIFIPTIVSSLINKKIQEKVVMTADNQQLWGELPGDSGVELHRQVTFYEFQNPMGAMFRGEKPVFIEKPGYDMLQYQSFLNPQFSNGQVSYNRYTHYQKAQPKLQSDQVTTVNPGGLGIWTFIKYMDTPTLTLSAVGAVIKNVNEQVPLNIYYLGLKNLFLKDYSQTATVLSSVSTEKRQAMWNDTYHGLSSTSTMEYWVKAALESDDYGTNSKVIKDYFQITQDQMASINSKMRFFIGSLNQTAFQYYGCSVPPLKLFKYNCTGEYFTALQFSSQKVTKQPPPGLGIPVHDSVVQLNDTLHDYPEINYFYTEFFLKNISNETEYQNIQFSVDWIMGFFARNYDYPTTPQYTNESILLHKANIRYLFEQGWKFDASQNVTDLGDMMKRFKMPSVYHARVIWEWIKNINSNFTKRENFNGNTQIAGIALMVTEQMFYNFRNLTEYLLPHLVSGMVEMKQNWTNCSYMLNSSIDGLNEAQINATCALPSFGTFKDAITNIFQLCDQINSKEWSDFKNNSGFNNFQMTQICQEGKTNTSFQTYISESGEALKSKYNCTFETCSKFEIALKQWASVEITMNPPEGFNQSNTIHEWNPQIFKRPYEYGYFRKEFNKTQSLSFEDAKQLMNFRRLFNTLAVTTAFAYQKSNQTEAFQQMFIFKEFDDLLDYLRFITMEHSFGGLTMQRTPEEILFGYKDENIDIIKHKDPAGGSGQPDKPSWIMFNDANMSRDDALKFPQSMHTGANDLSKTRKFASLNNFTNAMCNVTIFDGNQTQEVWQNPWEVQEDITEGSDGIINPPSPGDSITVYVPNIYRKLYFNKTGDSHELFGVETHRYKLNYSQPANQGYLNTKKGVHNLSLPYSAPVMVTMPHFLGCDEDVANAVDILDIKGNKVTANKYDDSYQDVEPYSGVPLRAMIQLAVNIELDKDELFRNLSYSLLPVLSLQITCNFTESAANNQFDELKMGLKTKRIGQIVCLVVGCVFVALVLGWLLWQITRKSKDERNRLYADPINQSVENGHSLNQHLVSTKVEDA